MHSARPFGMCVRSGSIHRVKPTEPSTQLRPRRLGSVPRKLRIAVVDGPDAGTVFEGGETGHHSLSVGVSRDNDLVLSDPMVSRYHLELSPGDGGIVVKDLGSLNGTFAGDFCVTLAVVPAGTTLRIGESAFTVDDGDVTVEETEPVPRVPGLVAESPAMQSIVRALHRLATSDVSVLVQGDTGTGKEVIAEALHRLGNRREGPFEVVDCGSMPATLIAAELFGHERGAFTGADRQRAGAFERAHGGTLFLDEIGELPVELQPALLGALERRKFRRVGGQKEIEVDIRVVSATHRDLRETVNDGSFRADLYYRLAVVRLFIPPLRERPEDIVPLAHHIVSELTGDPEARPFGYGMIEALRAHRWSGNVRELRNVLESALTIGNVRLEGEDVGDLERPRGPLPYRRAKAEAIYRFEHAYLKDLIESTGMNASEAARRAHMDRPYLLSLLRKHGLRE